jgi:hypothetical protein
MLCPCRGLSKFLFQHHFNREITMRISLTLASILLLSLGSASAQSNFPTEYPAEAQPVAGSDIEARLSGKAFMVKSVSSGGWRMEFSKNGYVYIDTDSGFRETGTWRVEGDKWCVKTQRNGDNCADLHAVGETLYYKRARNGEVVPMNQR